MIVKILRFTNQHYSDFIKVITYPIFSFAWLACSCIEALTFAHRQKFNSSELKTKIWRDFLFDKINKTEGEIIFKTTKSVKKKIRFIYSTSQEHWRFNSLMHKEPDTIAWLDKFIDDLEVNFIDVGANIGIYSLYWLSMTNKNNAFLFEPLPGNLVALQQNIKINRFENRSKIFPIAAHQVNSFITLNSNSFSVGEGRATTVVSTDLMFDSILVSSKRLDDCLDNTKKYILKIDVEGAELDVLFGADDLFQKQKVISVLFESNKNNNEIFEFLKNYGFELDSYIKPNHNIIMNLV